MNHFSVQPIYDYSIYPSRWPFIFFSVLFWVGFIVACLFVYNGSINLANWEWLAMVVGSGLMAFVMTICAVVIPRRITVGINSEGVFVRRYGMVLWSEIKGFEIDNKVVNGHVETNIFIKLHNSDDFFSRLTKWHQRLGRHATHGRVAIPASLVSMKLEALLNLLQECHHSSMQH